MDSEVIKITKNSSVIRSVISKLKKKINNKL